MLRALRILREDKAKIKPQPTEEVDVEDIETPDDVEDQEVDTETIDREEQETDDIDEQTKISSFQAMINDLSQQAWALSGSVNTVISTIKDNLSDFENADNIIDVLTAVNKDFAVSIGMIYSTLDMIDSKTSELIETGSEKAEDIVAENE